MSISERLSAGEYTLILNKCVHQRPEHIISVKTYFPKIHKYVFAHVHKFEEIPSHFNEIHYMILRKGKEIDGSIYGRYALTPHGRGKAHGLKGSDCRYKAGCIINFDAKNSYVIKDKKFNQIAFNKLLSTVKEVNAKLGKF